MNIFERFGNFAYKQLKVRFGKPSQFMPFATPRSSEPQWQGYMPNRKLQEVQIDFAREWFDTIEHLAVYNEDVSYALDNIVQLANTEHQITFSDAVSEDQASEMRQYLKEEERNWYNFSGGTRSLKSDLLAQVVINGALSAEIVPDRSLSFVQQIVRVAPKHITFVYNNKRLTYDPYQIVHNPFNVKTEFHGLKPLNTKTYKYIAWRRISEGPYPLPPFIAAIEGLLVHKDMKDNLKNVMKKLGMLGFLSAEVEPPEQEAGESEQEYHNRMIEYLDKKVYPQLEKNLGKGMVAGFKGTHEFKLQGNNMNVAGAEKLVQLVQLMIFSGLKQDPNMLGRNYSTTETFGRVILQKMLSQIRDYQQVVDTFFREAYYMSLRLGGFSPGYVEVRSETPMVGDKLKEEQAEKNRINNIIKKRNAGFIDQTQAANEAGYDEPAAPGSIAPAPDNNNDDDDPDKKDPSEEPDTESEIKRFEAVLKKSLPEYQYHTIDCSGHTRQSMYSFQTTEFDDPQATQYAKEYFSESYDKYRKAIKRITNKIVTELQKMDDSIPLKDVQDKVYLELIRNWEEEYVINQENVTDDHVEKIYDYFRKDKSVFPGENNSFAKGKMRYDDDFVIPDAILDADDFRAIDYAKRSDSMYLGKFITDEDVKKTVYRGIEEKYVSGELPFGNNPGHIRDFQNEFQETMNLKGWKMRQIIDTTVNNIRNDANILYMDQARVELFEIVELVDYKTCEYCMHMNGKRFSVGNTKQKINNKIDAGPENIDEVSPFATNIKINDFTNMDADVLASHNIQQPCYHPLCRGRVVAVV